jgi:hypothetical protein
MDLTDIIIAAVSAVFGWQSGRIGAREVKAMAIVVLGWTAVTTVASLGYIDVSGILAVLVFRALLIVAPFTIAALARRLRDRRR